MVGLTALVFISCLVLCKVSGETLVEKLKEELTEVSEFLEVEADEAKRSFSEGLNSMRYYHRELSDKVGRMNNLYYRATSIAKSVPAECQNDVETRLAVLKSNGVHSFLTCTKLVEAGEDVAEVGMKTVDIVFDIIDIGRDMTSGFAGCLASFWPWKIVGCLYDRVSTTYDDIKRTMSDIKDYGSDISSYVHNASVLLKYCWDGSPVEADVLSVMTPLHQCAKTPVPHQLYKL